jgi:hypothetical protein
MKPRLDVGQNKNSSIVPTFNKYVEKLIFWVQEKKDITYIMQCEPWMNHRLKGLRDL